MIEDIKHTHKMEREAIRAECERVKAELRMLRIEHGELISGIDIKSELENLGAMWGEEVRVVREWANREIQDRDLRILELEREL
jgi:hypothetical protein